MIEHLIYLRSDGVRPLIDLFVGEADIVIHDREIIGRLSRLLTEERDNGLGVVIRHLRLIERVEHRCLGFIKKRDSTQRSVSVRRKSQHGIRYRLREVGDERFAIPSVVVLDRNTRHAVHRHDIERDFEFRHVLLHGLVGANGFAKDAIVAQHAHLVSEHDLRLQVIIRCYACKRIILVRERLLEGLRVLFNKLLYRLVRYLRSQRKGVDEHSHGVVHPQVASSVGDGGDADIICSCKTCQGIIDGAKEHSCRRHA